MKDSTRRAMRTLLHSAIGALIAIPVMAAALPTPTGRIGAIVATVVAICAAVAKVINALEDAGTIPAFFKAPASDGADPIPSVPVDPATGAGQDPATGQASAALLAVILIVLAAAILGFAVNHLFFFLLLLIAVAFFI